MKALARFVPVVASLVMLLNITPSWGQLVNPTDSDNNGNTAGGTEALIKVVEGPMGGFNNTGFGENALSLTTTGSNNTAYGFFAMSLNAVGSNNTAVGADALHGNTTGQENTGMGFRALSDNSTGSRNTAVGRSALLHSTGTKNIGIGWQAGVTLHTGNNNIYIGNQGNGDEFQTIRIGTAQGQTFIAGIGTVPVSGAIVMVDSGTGQLGIGPPSSARYKQDIETMGNRSSGMLQLRPVTFTYRGEASGTAHYGLVAEEVAAVYPELVIRSATGEVQTVKYHELIPMLLNELQHEHQALQREHQALEQQRAEVGMLRQELAELRSLVGARLAQ